MLVKTKYISLNKVSNNDNVRIHSIDSGCGAKKRLTELGFVRNEYVRILNKSLFGPLVVDLKGSRIAIGYGEAKKILVYV